MGWDRQSRCASRSRREKEGRGELQHQLERDEKSTMTMMSSMATSMMRIAKQR